MSERAFVSAALPPDVRWRLRPTERSSKLESGLRPEIGA